MTLLETAFVVIGGLLTAAVALPLLSFIIIDWWKSR